jgi:hypothetical protein
MPTYRTAQSPQQEQSQAYEAGPSEMHIVKKYGKFHGHMKMADGAEHHAPAHMSMPEAHEAMGHMMEQHAMPSNEVESASELAKEDVNA